MAVGAGSSQILIRLFYGSPFLSSLCQTGFAVNEKIC